MFYFVKDAPVATPAEEAAPAKEAAPADEAAPAVAPVPAAPRDLQVLEAGASSITLGWSQPDTGADGEAKRVVFILSKSLLLS